MPTLPTVPGVSSEAVVDAALPTVAAAVREHRTGPPGRHPTGMCLGDEIDAPLHLASGLRVPLRWRLAELDLHRLTREQTGGPPLRLTHTCALTDSGAGTRVTDTVHWRRTPADALVRALVTAALRRRTVRIRRTAERLSAAPVVVAAAVLRDGRLLAQQRARPAELAGRWELPGGRVEPGESPPGALARECREELAVRVEVDGQLGPDVPLPSGHVLRVHAVRLADPADEPVAVEHAALRWVGPDELSTLDWLDADRAVLTDLTQALRTRPVP